MSHCETSAWLRCEPRIRCSALRSTRSTSNCLIDRLDFGSTFPQQVAHMADLMKILQQAQQMQGRLQQMQDELQTRTVSAASGGGMVTVEADGRGQVTRIKIDPSVVSASDLEMLEDLVLAAVREAQKKASDMAKDEMGKLTGG